MINAIAFTCYPVSDITRGRRFYEDVLSLSPAENFGDMWQEYTVGDATFAIVAMGDDAPECFKNTRGTTIAFEVEHLDDTLAALKAKDVPVVLGPYDSPVCRMAVITDPDNNLITLHQQTRSA